MHWTCSSEQVNSDTGLRALRSLVAPGNHSSVWAGLDGGVQGPGRRGEGTSLRLGCQEWLRRGCHLYTEAWRATSDLRVWPGWKENMLNALKMYVSRVLSLWTCSSASRIFPKELIRQVHEYVRTRIFTSPTYTRRERTIKKDKKKKKNNLDNQQEAAG